MLVSTNNLDILTVAILLHFTDSQEITNYVVLIKHDDESFSSIVAGDSKLKDELSKTYLTSVTVVHLKRLSFIKSISFFTIKGKNFLIQK